MSTKTHTCVKTDRGGPYIFRNIDPLGTNESFVIPISLRGADTNEQWSGDTQEACIDNIRSTFSQIEVHSFDTWQEMLQWAMNEPYLTDPFT